MNRPLALCCLALLVLAGCQHTVEPDGDAAATYDLLFEGYLGAQPELLRLDAQTGRVNRVLPPGTGAKDPAPSPDGARIAYVVSDDIAATGDIFVANRDGTGVVQITFDPELDDQPAWSPDGLRIAFRSFRTQHAGDIWLMDADGGNPVNLTPDPLPGVTDESRPAWSPDGARLAYVSDAGGNFDIWTMNADGSDPQRLTNSPDLDAEPAWSPFGDTIAFRRSSGSAGSDIHLVPAAGGAPVPLALGAEQRMPTWTPSGTSLVFVNQSSVSSRPDLYIVRADGMKLRPLVASAVPGGCLNPAYLKRPQS